MREAALDQLHRPAQWALVVERKQQVDMVRHYDVLVHLKLPGTAITKNRGDHQLRYLSSLEEVLVHVRAGCHEVGHQASGAKAPGIKQSRQRGPKGPLYRSCLNPALKGPLYQLSFTT